MKNKLLKYSNLKTRIITKIITKLINIIAITFFLLLSFLCIKSHAKSTVTLNVNEDILENGEDFSLSVNANNVDMAACTIWLYFDSEKLKCISDMDNINVIDNRVVYTWVSDIGTDKNVEELLKINFEAKQDGVASFAIVGEFYNEKGEEIDVSYNQKDIQIGGEQQGGEEQNEDKGRTEMQEEAGADKEGQASENVADNNANLKVMRLNMEGVNPDFDKDITEYYLIVDESVNNIDVTAIAENKDANVEISENKGLKNGVNKIKILVTSKDKTTKKEYIINVTKTDNVEAANTNLETLAVEYYTLSPEYNANVTNYNVEVSNLTNDLNILAIPEDEDAKVDINGNKNLKNGNNKVIISVTAENGITKKDYLINVYKRNEDEEKENEQKQQNIIQEANTVMERIATESEEETAGDTEDEQENENQEQIVSNETAQGKAIMIIGSIASVMVLGLSVYTIKRKKGE